MFRDMASNNKIGNSLKWSTAGEVLAKLIAPITNMILARILAPEDFGVLATVNMIITFVDLFTDSGFSKYIIQCDFDSKDDVNDYSTVAFWTNLSLSILLWGIIYFFRYPIARVVGNVGYENVIIIASTQLIATAFSSIQTAIYRRFFNFKVLFISRIIMSLVPLCITVPMAFVLKNYWALVIGAIVQQVANAIFLTIVSSWKPKLYYSFNKLKKMLSYSLWSLVEALAYWATTWFDVFLIGAAFSAYYLGLYKNSLNMVNSLVLLVKASVIPVLFSALSRLKNKQEQLEKVFYSLQEAASCIVVPMGVGIFVYRRLATLILFGSKWSEASSIVGVWALSSAVNVVFLGFFAEAFKAKGIPKILFIYEVISLAIMVPICLVFKSLGFWSFVYARGMVVIVQIIIGMIFMNKYIGMSSWKMIQSIIPSAVCSAIMATVGSILLYFFESVIWQLGSIIVCIAVYFLCLRLFFKNRLRNMLSLLKGRGTEIDL